MPRKYIWLKHYPDGSHAMIYPDFSWELHVNNYRTFWGTAESLEAAQKELTATHNHTIVERWMRGQFFAGGFLCPLGPK
jgi:hypothetical protein